MYQYYRIAVVSFCFAQSLLAENGDGNETKNEPVGQQESAAVPSVEKEPSTPTSSDTEPPDVDEGDSLDESSSDPGTAPKEVSPVISSDQSWIDDSHSWLYNESQDMIEWFDNLFVSDESEALDVPPSRFRLGMFAEFDLDEDRDFKLAPIVDLKTDIHLPNLERRLKLFISTRDPSALPDENIADANNELRVGATRDFFKNWNTSVGVKARWPPEAFANVEWSPTYKLPNYLTLYPRIKPYWDNDRGFGGMGSMIVDKWRKRWLFRQVVSAKWDQKDYDEDKENANDPDSYQYGQNGEGYRWSLSTVIGYVPSLLDEKEYGRRVSGSDVADGWGLRGRMDGNISQSLQYDITLFRKAPLYKDYLFYVIAPEVSWERSTGWETEYSIQIGFEVLLWGEKTYTKR